MKASVKTGGIGLGLFSPWIASALKDRGVHAKQCGSRCPLAWMRKAL
ncbi:MAG: hypothetical protein ACMUIS_04860 [bacterium]